MQKLVDTAAIRVRNNASDQPFWYTAGVPGPYYINVERLAGPDWVVESLLKITDILNNGRNRSEQAQAIEQLIMTRFHASEEYQSIIQYLAGDYRKHKQADAELVSGGERRDWFFSIPFAHVLGLPHLFLFKNGDFVLDGDNQSHANRSVLHVCDIVNTATSYVRSWLPILRGLNVRIIETTSVAVRGEKGVRVLNEEGLRVISPFKMNEASFAKLRDMGLISSFAYHDVVLYQQSPKEWTKRLIQESGDRMLGSVQELSESNHARLQAFVENDVFHLREEFPDFFEAASRVLVV